MGPRVRKLQGNENGDSSNRKDVLKETGLGLWSAWLGDQQEPKGYIHGNPSQNQMKYI